MNGKFQKLKQLISEKFGVSQDLITLEANLTADLNLSALEITDLIGLCSNEFDLKFADDTEIGEINKISDLINLIEEYSEEL